MKKFLGGSSPETYLDLLHRLYHTWCMFIGFVMVVFISVQGSIAVFEEFFSNAWLYANSSAGLALFASAIVSILILDVSMAACVSAVFLMGDVWEMTPFAGFCSLLLFEPLSARIGEHGEEQDAATRRRKHFLLMAVYCVLDVVPVLVAIFARDGSAWAASVAVVSVLMVVVFWIADVAHDYYCKVGAWKWLRVEPLDAMGPDTLLSLRSEQDEAAQALVSFVEDQTTDVESYHCLHKAWNYAKVHPCARFCAMLVSVVILWVLVAASGQMLLLIASCTASLLMIIQVVVDLIHGRFHWCTCCRRCYRKNQLLFHVKPKTQQQNEHLAGHVDSNFVVTRTCCLDGCVVPAGSQLVSDGVMTFGEVSERMKMYPAGTVYSFRHYILTKTDMFIEIHCGGSPVQLCVNGLLILGWCSLCLAIMLLGKFFDLLFISVAGVLVFLMPIILVFVAPRFAPKVHFFLCLSVSVVGMISGMAASRPTGVMFWIMPVLCVLSHCLLHRRLQYRMVVAASLGLVMAFVGALFFSQALGAAYQTPFKSHSFADLNQSFQFNASGTRNPYPGPGRVRSPVCLLNYPTSDPSLPLDVIDFAFFNKVVYEPDENLRDQLQHFMSDWTLTKSVRRENKGSCSDASACQTVDWTSWFAFEGKEGRLQNTTVVTIRGTKSILETIFDMDLWSLDVLGLNTFAGRFGGVGRVVDSLWESKAFGSIYFKWKRARYAGVWNYIKNKLEQEPDRVIYISGHSLGGGLAQVVAAQVAAEVPSRKITAVSISAPGIKETVRKLGFDPYSLQGLAVNIVPKGDPVPTSGGTQAGVTYQIPCLASGINCHRVFNTVCELMRECGDSKVPKRVMPCSFCPLQAGQFFDMGKAPQCWKQATAGGGGGGRPPWDPRPPPPTAHYNNETSERSVIV